MIAYINIPYMDPMNYRNPPALAKPLAPLAPHLPRADRADPRAEGTALGGPEGTCDGTSASPASQVVS